MSNLKLATVTEFATVECTNCGTMFAMTNDLDQNRQRSHTTFYCPNGHGQVYAGKSREEKLAEELADAQRRLAAESERATTNYRLREKAERELKKFSKRAACGVCPECNRTFVALGRHMKTKHPDFVEAQKNA